MHNHFLTFTRYEVALEIFQMDVLVFLLVLYEFVLSARSLSSWVNLTVDFMTEKAFCFFFGPCRQLLGQMF
jgi:hypothetical protein